METLAVEGQLGFMDDQPGVHSALPDGVGDLVEGRDDRFEIRLVEFAGQIRGGHRTGDGDALALEFLGLHGPGGDDHGAVAIADAGAAGHEHVLVGDVRIGMIGDGAEIVLAFHGLAVQRLDVLQHVAKGDSRRAHLLRRQAIKHEGVVGIRAVSADDFLGSNQCHKRNFQFTLTEGYSL